MTDWKTDLDSALASGNATLMKTSLARIPKVVLLQAIPLVDELARSNAAEGRLEEAVACYDQLIEWVPGNVDWPAERTRVQAAIPSGISENMMAGVLAHLRRYGAHQQCKNVLVRLEDPVWLAAWDAALAGAAGAFLFHGSELGVLALRALNYSTTPIQTLEHSPQIARIAAGVVQKHYLKVWHAQHGAAIHGWTDVERRASFEALAGRIEVGTADESVARMPRDCFIFPNIDHSLLGTGIVTAVAQHKKSQPLAPRILPARAKIHAIAIRWNYPSSSFDLEPMQQLRWSPYPQPLELAREFWTALTAPALVGTLDFENFAPAVWHAQLPVVAEGKVDAIVYWFELDLGASAISNAPDSDLRCIKAAVQYADSTQQVTPGQSFAIQIHVSETRMNFQTVPAVTHTGSRGLPNWYVPMLLDRPRNEAYGMAIAKALRLQETRTVLDIGAGCGLLSMMAADSGADRVVGCEADPAIGRIGRQIISLNGFDDRVTLLDQNIQRMALSPEFPERADLAVFELFDCSLIGEGVLHFLAHARSHLLADTARFRPIGATIRAMVIEYRLDKIWDLDVNLLNPYRYAPGFINVDAAHLVYTPLTEPVDVFAFDFATATPTPASIELTLPVTVPGTAGAVLFWFDLQLDETSRLSNAPGTAHSPHWKQGLQFLPEITVDMSLRLPLSAQHDGSALAFAWKRAALPDAAFSKLPRFDPRWVAAATQLDQQTESLLQHCRTDAGEFKRVAALAERYAIDPGAHGLDPVIAQRFASMFFGA